MKIGILTYHSVPNFGAQLQTISTVGYLRRIGHEPIVLHWYPQDLEEMYSKRIPAEQVAEHFKFAEQNMPLSNLCRSELDLISEIDRLDLDAVFVGSDALLKYVPKSKRVVFSKRKLRFVKRKLLTVELIDGNAFFGGFLSKITKKIKAVAFSVSSQNCDYLRMDESERTLMKSGLDNYTQISVRDEWTRQMVKTIVGREDVDISPDPVFAFNQNCYLDLPSKNVLLEKFSIPDNYVLLSFWTNRLPETYVKSLADELKENGLTPVAFPMPEKLKDYGLKHRINLPISPSDWYALIKYSKGYIGERMHPIVVSLHNAVPFFCFDEYGTFKKTLWGLRKKYIPSSSKTYHILNKAGLGEYMYSYFDKTSKMPNPSEVIRKFLSFPRQKCANFAEKYLNVYNQSMSKILKGLE